MVELKRLLFLVKNVDNYTHKHVEDEKRTNNHEKDEEEHLERFLVFDRNSINF